MKGVSFQNGVEFKIQIEGESWQPGDLIKGQIESKPLAEGSLYFVEGIDKKIKTKSADAFIILKEQNAKTLPQEWEYSIPMDARISDKNGSLYLLYGRGDALEKLGLLKLNIIPHLLIRDLIALICGNFRFAQKNLSAGKKGLAEIKLDPPGVKEWAMLEQLVLFAKISDSHLECNFQFHRKEVDATKGGLATKTVKREIKKEWKRNEITYDFNQRLNTEVMMVEIEKIIAEYRSQGWLAQ